MAGVGRQGKRKLEEEISVNTKENNVETEEYDSDDDMYAGNQRMTREMRDEYNRQIDESEGFDITLDVELGVSIGAPIIPHRRGKEHGPKFVEISCLAIDAYNLQNNKIFEFVENVTVNTSLAAGYWCYNTFRARDSDAPNAVKTFQALGYWGISGKRIISFCRLKKTSSDEGDECPPDSCVDVKG
ncbi:uncharacterized protein LOC132058468 isoform X1 [Lycium ferocissimum]|uniref:uncharacterized protein LOC132058468 isoform X1 n=1 Tax=Lycium ferocissimum TaxID=112874 RepID=UPI00281566BE|nr:uncharacterized protein LOC132058468 isoform X1 [Lycium ferocissimum]